MLQGIKKMKKLDVATLSTKALNQLHNQILSELEKRSEKQKAIQEVKKLASSKGIDLKDLVDEISAKSKTKNGRIRAAVPVKFRHPENTTLTWTGRGKRPNWFREALNEGLSETDLAA